MRVVQRPVRAELAPFVRSIWLFEAELAHGREHILPAGASQLLVNLVDDELRAWRGDDLSRLGAVEGAALTGVTDEPFAIDTAQQRRIAGVAFRPGGARMFFALPMSEIRDRDLSLSALWGPAGTRLRLRMLEASDDSTRLALLEEALLAHLRPDRDRAMELAVAALERGQNVGSLARVLDSKDVPR
ncbi:transcriptional regulator, AraC family protein [Plesiocystis pacifica SIR-1]|uniref:Transcriptional regulator, AraC family protein n=1 Tax=Plesiocystis pacifica SIR-1 TaxID=391625 RepID=A6G5V6_9BACT|nr:transcriptional regulator, AraC family protein [Plesiocystis pacifica SIR-1]